MYYELVIFEQVKLLNDSLETKYQTDLNRLADLKTKQRLIVTSHINHIIMSIANQTMTKFQQSIHFKA